MLTGLGGNDTLNGGAGADTMIGGLGNDIYVVDNAGDVVDETGGDGTDTVQSSVTFSLSDAVRAIGDIENLTLTGSGASTAPATRSTTSSPATAATTSWPGLGGADTSGSAVAASTRRPMRPPPRASTSA